MNPNDQDTTQQAPPPEPSPTPTERPGIWTRVSKRLLFFGFVAIVAVVLFAVANMDNYVSFINKLSDIISPLIIGCVIAYLCDPILEFFEYRVFKRMAKGSARRGLSLAMTVISAVAVVAVVALMMIPELVKSIQKLIEESNNYINEFLVFLQNIVGQINEKFGTEIEVEGIQQGMLDMFGSVEGWLAKLTDSDTLVTVGGTLWDMALSVVNVFKNFFLGLFIAFYLLASKEKRIAQITKFREAMFTDKQNKKITEFVSLTDHCFGGFIFGKLIDSLVIGILTFVLLTIFKISDYNVLIATFVGLTNVIPVFGPFIGAIPSAFIVLISNPSKAVLFIILILIVQQLDGNIIGPKILGDNTGVSSLCVIIAITVCGSMWGIPGMIVGVPIFAVIIEWVKRLLEKRLAEKGKATDTEAYYPKDAVGNAEQDLYYEHSGLLYQYEHSGLKPKLERLRNRIFKHLGRQDKKEKKPPKNKK